MLRSFVTKKNMLYVFFGVCTTVIHIVLWNLFSSLGYSTVFSNGIGIFLAIVFAFFTNKVWVFQSHSFEIQLVMKEFMTFFIGRVGTAILDTIFLYLLVDVLLLERWFVRIGLSGLSLVLNYWISQKIAFKKRIE